MSAGTFETIAKVVRALHAVRRNCRETPGVVRISFSTTPSGQPAYRVVADVPFDINAQEAISSDAPSIEEAFEKFTEQFWDACCRDLERRRTELSMLARDIETLGDCTHEHEASK